MVKKKILASFILLYALTPAFAGSLEQDIPQPGDPDFIGPPPPPTSQGE
ncbi:hypothetical protein [Virgibacillus sp. Bac332]|nr:hypothetical protein [Virgibacillus sp. Bac332]